MFACQEKNKAFYKFDVKKINYIINKLDDNNGMASSILKNCVVSVILRDRYEQLFISKK